MKNYVSIDIGGTAIKYGIINENGNIVKKEVMKTEAHKGGKSILDKAIKIVENYIKDFDISGICISTAGMVDEVKGEIFYSAPLIPNYTGTKFKATMEEKFNIPCEVENDVNCAGLAEYISGASKGSKVALMLTIGTGIGGCIVIDGKVYHGFSGSACEVGYMNMNNSDFQSLGAASVLSRKVAKRKNQSVQKWNGFRVFDEAKKGDEVCIRAIDEMVDTLGKGIANICYVLNPEVVVLGGGIMSEELYLKDKIEKSVQKWLIPAISSKTKIAFAKHKNSASMLGAFYNFKQMQSERQR